MSVNIYSSSRLTPIAGGKSTGHNIVDENDIVYDQRSDLKFIGATITDDNINDTTIVEIEKPINIKASYDESTALYDHAVGDFVYITGYLYKVTQAIAVGDSISTSTNITADTGLDANTAIYIDNIPKELEPISVPKPTVSVGTYTYNGNAQGPTIAGYDSTTMVISNASKVNAGNYTLTIALKNTNLMQWEDGTTADLTYEYTIGKAASSITTSVDSITLDSSSLTDTFTYTVVGDGNVSVSSSDTTVVTVSGNTSPVTVSNVNEKSGSANITITLAEGDNYLGATKVVSVIAKFIKIVTFSDGTDAEIKAMLDAYYNDDITWAEMGWAIGDTRKIHLNAMQAPNPNSSNTWAAQDITIVIVAHDQNDLATPINGHTKACITTQTKEVLNNNSQGYNQAGHIYVKGSSSYDPSFTKWADLYMRTYLNNIVAQAISSSIFKSAIKPTKHYRHTDYNTADDEQVTDTLFLPSYPEIFGTASYTYYTPTTHTEGTQWPYYQISSNRIKYGNNNGASNNVAQLWWQGSTSSYYNSSQAYHWGSIFSDGSSTYYYTGIACGLAPAFAM